MDHDITIVGEKRFLRERLKLISYICVQCGYVMLNVTDSGLVGLEEKLQKWGWTAIKEVGRDGAVLPSSE